MGQSRLRQMGRSEYKCSRPETPPDPNRTAKGGLLPKVVCSYCQTYQRHQDGVFRDHGMRYDWQRACPGSGQPVTEASGR